MTKLKPCPKCKADPIPRERKLSANWATIYFVQCPECGASTDPYWTPEEARSAWNRRKVTP